MKIIHYYLKPWRLACVAAMALSGVLGGAFCHAQALSIIDLKHRRADELIPVLQPLVTPGTALTGIDYKLIVKGSDNDVRRIREALAVLDQAQKQLLLSVRSATSGDLDTNQAQVTGSVGTNTQLSLRTGANRADTSSGNVNTMRVTEGQSAYINNGQLVPFVGAIVTQPSGIITNNNRTDNRNSVVIEQRQVGTGIQVRPRVNGDTVIIDISMQQDQLNGANVAVNHVSSQVSGKLGQWLPLSQIDNSVRERQSNLIGGSIHTANEQRSVWVKVELISD